MLVQIHSRPDLAGGDDLTHHQTSRCLSSGRSLIDQGYSPHLSGRAHRSVQVFSPLSGGGRGGKWWGKESMLSGKSSCGALPCRHGRPVITRIFWPGIPRRRMNIQFGRECHLRGSAENSFSIIHSGRWPTGRPSPLLGKELGAIVMLALSERSPTTSKA